MAHLELQSLTGISDIFLDNGLLNKVAEKCSEKFQPSRIHIVTDSNVAPLYLTNVIQQFSLPVTFSILPAGEEHKRLSTVEGLYHDLLAAGITRQDLIIALGGGVVGDITGFTASTFLRGITLCQIPTTLLAQVDSSVGGKTGVDLEEGKNLVGAFYQPGLVLIDPNALNTLSPSTFADGMAEVIKYGCIRSTSILSMVTASDFRSNLIKIIYECVRIKRDIVELDERDTGVRMILNFGHTIGHAAEKLGNYTALTHGQAVAIGMVAAMELSNHMGAIEDLTSDLIKILTMHHLPTELTYNREKIANALLSDKKKFGNSINFVFVREFGRAEVEKIEVCRLHEMILKL